MKFLYHIAILIGIVIVIYIARDDFKPLYDKTVKLVENSYSNVKSDLSKINTTDLTPPDTSEGSISTPGALRVTTGLTSFDQVKLSKNEVIVETNKNRAENGSLPPLTESSKLDASAEIKLKDMFAQQYFEHVSPTGVGIKDLAKEEGYEYILIGENLALGNFKDSSSLLAAWMASPGHRANILNKHYTEIGVAVGSGVFEGHHVWLAVQHFGAPRSVCPSVDAVLGAKVKVEERELDAMNADLDKRRKEIDSGAIYDGKDTNEQIDEYNAIVPVFNNKIEIEKSDRTKYNSQILALNDCIKINSGK